MKLFRSKEERAAREAEVDRRDHEHAARLAAATAETRKGPLRCQDCLAKLSSAATRCHYCGGENLARRDPSCPRFSEAVKDGKCPSCGGSQFTLPGGEAGSVIAGYAMAGLLGAAVAGSGAQRVVVCVTCGARFARG